MVYIHAALTTDWQMSMCNSQGITHQFLSQIYMGPQHLATLLQVLLSLDSGVSCYLIVTKISCKQYEYDKFDNILIHVANFNYNLILKQLFNNNSISPRGKIILLWNSIVKTSYINWLCKIILKAPKVSSHLQYCGFKEF